jgi:hypothetical protein
MVPVGASATYTVYAEDICAAYSDTVDVDLSVNIPPPPIVSISGPTSFDCVPETILLSASTIQGTPPFSYVWSNGSAGANLSFSAESDTSFTVTVTDGCGEQMTSSLFEIEQNPVPAPSVQTSLDVVLDCPGEQATLTAIASGGNPPYQYVWSNAAITSTITVQPTETTEYIVTVTDNCFVGSVQDTITVTVEPYTPPTVTVADTSVVCPGDLALLDSDLTGGNDPFTYSWSDGGGGTSTSLNPEVTTDITLIVTDDCGESTSDMATITVPVYGALSVEVLSTDLATSDTLTICELWSDTAWSAVSGGLAPYSYTWSGTLIEGVYMNNDSAVMSVPYELTPDSTVYEIYSLYVVDECATDTLVEFPVEVISCDVQSPSIFNPNSDFTGSSDICGNTPQNNVFNLPCLELYPGNEVTIWDRWGRKCYQTENYHLSPWDGGNQATGTYYYVCELPNGKEPVKGFFQLVR